VTSRLITNFYMLLFSPLFYLSYLIQKNCIIVHILASGVLVLVVEVLNLILSQARTETTRHALLFTIQCLEFHTVEIV
jgi:hypothetical protein